MNCEQKIPLVLIVVMGFVLCSIPLTAYTIPLSWEGFYHVRIAENFAAGHILYDAGAFGPEGRAHVFPPLFHFLSAVLVKFADSSVIARWTPPFMFCALLVVWFYLISRLYSVNIALLSSLFLLAIPAFVDLGVLFSPHILSLILVFSALFFLGSHNSIASGICGGMVVLTQFTAAFYLFLAVIVWSILGKEKRKALTMMGVSVAVALPYLAYFGYHFPSFNLVLGNLGLKYFFLKTTFLITALAVLGLRKDSFAVSLGVSGLGLALLQPTNFCYLAFPLALFSAFFVHNFFSHKKWAITAFAIVFWLCLIPSHEYVSKMQPAASEYESFVWLRENSVSSVVASGWYQAPIIASVSERVPVLGFGFPEEKRVEDMRLLYNGDGTLLDYYDISYVYLGEHEAYDYNSVTLHLDKVYSGKGEFYKREPPLIYVLITVDVEPDLPPVLTSYKGIEEGLPYIVQLLDEYDICATFFVLGETAEAYPSVIKELAESHEVGCHSLYHEDLRSLSYDEKQQRVEKATAILEELAGDVTSFRAPGHSCDTELIHVLVQQGYAVEASACKQISYPYHPSEEDWLEKGGMDFLRVPISHAPAYFYAPLLYPRSWIDSYFDALHMQSNRVKIIVVGLHPWECVNIDAPGYELYTQACGKYTRTEIDALLKFLDKRRVTFLTMRELYEMWKFSEKWMEI